MIYSVTLFDPSDIQGNPGLHNIHFDKTQTFE